MTFSLRSTSCLLKLPTGRGTTKYFSIWGSFFSTSPPFPLPVPDNYCTVLYLDNHWFPFILGRLKPSRGRAKFRPGSGKLTATITYNNNNSLSINKISFLRIGHKATQLNPINQATKTKNGSNSWLKGCIVTHFKPFKFNPEIFYSTNDSNSYLFN